MKRQEEINQGTTEDAEKENDFRIRRRLVKEQKRNERKLKNQEEFLKNLRKPKGTKVILVDRKFAEKLKGSDIAHGSNNFSAEFSNNAVDFPALTASSGHRRKSSKVKCKCSVGSSNVPSSGSNSESNKTATKFSFHGTEQMRADIVGEFSSTIEKVEHMTPEKKSKTATKLNSSPMNPPNMGNAKKVKKKDPIVLKVNDLIVKQQAELKNKKHPLYGYKYRRKKQSNVISGNMLDSSNPVRFRGKRPEHQKIRLSKLKTSIVTSRIIKAKSKSISLSDNSVDGTSVKTDALKVSKYEIANYLSDLFENKLNISQNKLKRKKDQNMVKCKMKEEEHCETQPEKEDKSNRIKRVKYRSYCDNIFSISLDSSVKQFIENITNLQQRAYARDSVKAAAKRRYVVGLREIKKHLSLKKIKLLVIAPDLEAQDAVTHVITELKESASAQCVPYVFALNRRKLGYITKKGVYVSAFGVLNYEGIEAGFQEVMEHVTDAKRKYTEGIHSDSNRSHVNHSCDENFV